MWQNRDMPPRKPKTPSATEFVVESVPIDDLVPDSHNARRGDVAAIAESLDEFGQHRPVVAQRGTNKIIAGNHLVRAARALGWDTVSVYWVDDSDDKALRRSLADNAAGDRAQWDDVQLAELLAQTGAVPGFSQDDVTKLLDKLSPPADEESPIFPIVARMNEKYDYVIVMASTEIDVLWLKEKFGIRPEQSYKNSNVAPAHVVTVERLQELWSN